MQMDNWIPKKTKMTLKDSRLKKTWNFGTNNARLHNFNLITIQSDQSLWHEKFNNRSEAVVGIIIWSKFQWEIINTISLFAFNLYEVIADE